MPNPKRRHSKQRKRSRRTHDKLDTPALSRCSNCNKNARPHRVCPHCGYYKGKPTLQVSQKKSK